MKNYYALYIFVLFFANTTIMAQKEATLKELLAKSRSYYTNQNFQQSLIIAELLLQKSLNQKNDSMIAYSYDMYGRNFSELYGSTKSIESFKKGLKYAEKINKVKIQKMFCNNIANVLCFDKKEFKEGIYFYKKGIELEKNKIDIDYDVLVKANIAWAYFEWNKYPLGLPYLNQVNEELERLGNTFTDIESKMIISMINGMYYSHMNNFSKAKKYFSKAFEISEKEDFLNKIYLYEEYAKFLSKSGDHKNALDNYKKFHQLRQEIYKEKKIDAMNVSALQRQLQNFKKEIKISEQKNISQSEKLKNSKIIGGLGMLFLLAMLIAFYLLLKNYRLKKQNILELEKINSELKISNTKAQEASMLKSQFISTITHELRTPLYGVVGITDLLIADHKNISNEKPLEALKFSASYLMTLVNDVLQVSQIEEGKIGLDESVFGLKETIFALKNSLQYLADNNNVSLKIEIDPAIPDLLYGDSQKLVQILINLVTNAIKFSPNGIVQIVIDLINVEMDTQYIDFKIIDNGIGIAIENQSKIFDNFTQVKQEKQEFEGSGLGLFIVKKVMTLFKSKIVLKSESGKGSTFSFSIGFEKFNPVLSDYNQENSYETIAELKSKPLRMLIVDDNRINQLVTKKIIERENHTCETISNGFEAIKLLKTTPFDFVLMDINMPDMNGYETTKRIREFDKDVKIVALSASTRDQITDSAFASGMNDVIIKPFKSDDFFKVIYKLM